MFEALLAAAGKVLDLLLKRGEHRQVKAQTALAEVELKEKESRIVPATWDKVVATDPTIREMKRRREWGDDTLACIERIPCDPQPAGPFPGPAAGASPKPDDEAE